MFALKQPVFVMLSDLGSSWLFLIISLPTLKFGVVCIGSVRANLILMYVDPGRAD
jgi:hypothetical protein